MEYQGPDSGRVGEAVSEWGGFLIAMAGLAVWWVIVLYRQHRRARRFFLAMEQSDKFHHEMLAKMYPEVKLGEWKPWEWLH
jgi:hypothetical protein